MATTKKEPVAICTAHYACDKEHVVEVYCGAIPPHYIKCPECGASAWRKLFHLDIVFVKPVSVPAGAYFSDGKTLVRMPEKADD